MASVTMSSQVHGAGHDLLDSIFGSSKFPLLPALDTPSASPLFAASDGQEFGMSEPDTAMMLDTEEQAPTEDMTRGLSDAAIELQTTDLDTADLDTAALDTAALDTVELNTEPPSTEATEEDAFGTAMEVPPISHNTGHHDLTSEPGMRPSRLDANTQAKEPPHAMLMFMLGEDRVTETIELGVLNEHPEALKAITENPTLSSSEFLRPASQAVMAELKPSLMVQMAVQLTILCFRLATDTLSFEDNERMTATSDEYQKLAKAVHSKFEEALPHYEWQGMTNRIGRVRYLMVLLEEVLRILGVETGSFTEGLRSSPSAESVWQNVEQAITKLGRSPGEVCGEWAAGVLISAWPKGLRSKRQRKSSVAGRDVGEYLALPKNVSNKARKGSDSLAKPGNSEDDPILVSDSEINNRATCREENVRSNKTEGLRSSRRRALQKPANYNMKRHPQDDDLRESGE